MKFKAKSILLLTSCMMFSTLLWNGVIKSENDTVLRAQAAEPIEIDLAQQGYASGAAVPTLTQNNITITFDKGSNSNNAPKYYSSGTAVRAYGGNTFTFTTTVGNITKIDFTFGSSDGKNAITSDSGTFSNNSWTGNSTSVKFTIGGSSGNRRLQKFVVTTSDSGTGSGSEVNPPVTETFMVTFNSNGGSAVEQQEVTSGSTATKPTDPTRDGYTFTGWYKDENCSNLFNFATDTISQDTTLYAGWEDSTLSKYVISFTHDTDSTKSLIVGSASSEYINEGATFISGISEVDKVYPQKNCLKFSSSSVDGHIKLDLSSDGKVFASKIVINASEYSTNENAMLSINDSEAQPISGDNNKYTFNLDLSNMITSIKLTATNRLYVNSINVYYKPVEKTKYQVDFISDGEVLETIVADGTTHLVTEPTKPTKNGYIFGGWYKDEAFTQVFNFDKDEVPEAGITLYAKWDEDLTGLIKETITREETTITGTSYEAWSYNTSNYTEFNGHSAGGHESIQLNSTSGHGIIIKSNHNLKRIVIQWNVDTTSGRTLNIYGNRSKYSSIEDLSNQSNQGILISSISENDQKLTSDVSFENDSQFNNIGICSAEGALYISSITFYWSENFYWDETTIDSTSRYEFSVGQTQPSLGFSYEVDSSSNYTFTKVRLQFKAVISSDLYNKINSTGAGIEITTNVGGQNKRLDIDCSNNVGTTAENDKYILGSLQVPDDQFGTQLTARAYFKVGEKKVYYKETTYSIKEIIGQYDATQFNEEIANALKALEVYINSK